MKSICVYCGSSPGRQPGYTRSAQRLADALVHRGIGLVYGGAQVGLMGEIADRVLAGGGPVLGVIPRALVEQEVAHRGLADLRIVESMHERKAIMAEASDGFIALPGGLGTLEELFEALTWSQLGLHAKPCGLLDAEGYYDLLLSFLRHAREEGFIRKVHSDLLLVDTDPDRLLDAMAAASIPKERA